MQTLQVRVPKGLVKEIDSFVKTGLYTNRSDVVRDALRILAWRKHIGTIPNTGDSVKEVRKIRKQLSKQDLDLDYINSL